MILNILQYFDDPIENEVLFPRAMVEHSLKNKLDIYIKILLKHTN